MATQKDPAALGVEEQKSEGLLDTVTGFIGDVAEDIGDFFSDDDETKLEESKLMTKEYIEDAQKIDEHGFTDSLSDLWNAATGFVNTEFNSDIQNKEAFNSIQEVRKNYEDEVLPIIKEVEELKALESLKEDQKERLEFLISRYNEVHETFNETETSLISKAIKGIDIEEKRKKLDSIYEELSGDGELSNESELVLKYSKKADDYLAEVSRRMAEYRGFESPSLAPSIAELKTSFAGHLANWEVNRIRVISKMKNLGFTQSEIENKIKLFNEQESLYKEVIEATISGAYAGITGDDMAGVVNAALGDKKTLRLVELERELMLDEQVQSGIQALKSGHIFSGIVNTLAGGLSKGTGVLTEGARELIGYDPAELLAKDVTEITTFDKTGLNKWSSWAMLNTDDVIANTAGVIVGGGLSSKGLSTIKEGANKLKYINQLNQVVSKNKTANYLINKGTFSVSNLTQNVVTGLIPNAIINTAAKDTTSEARILFDATMDLTLGPILDLIVHNKLTRAVGGKVKSLTKTTERLGGIGGLTRSEAINALKKDYGLKESDASDLLDTYKLWQQVTGRELKTDTEILDYVKDNADKITKAEGGVMEDKGIISSLRDDIESFTKYDTGVSGGLINKLAEGDIDLSKNTIEAYQAERIFNTIKNVDLTDRDIFIKSALNKMQVNKDTVDINTAKVEKIAEKMYQSAKELKEDIEKIEAAGKITEADSDILSKITTYYDNLNKLARKFSKNRQKVLLYDKTGKEIEVDITDIKTTGPRITRKSDKDTELFTTTSLMNKLKNNEFPEYTNDFAATTFVRTGDAPLNKEELANAITLIEKITGHKPKVISEEGIQNSTDIINIYKESATGRYKIYVGGKYLKDIEGSTHKVEIELSGDKYKKEIEKQKKYVDKLKKKDKAKGVEFKVKSKVFKLKTDKKRYFLTQLVELNKKNIQEGPINRAIWNRVLLSNKPFNEHEFIDLVSSEAINISGIIANKKEFILKQGITIKSINELKTFLKPNLKKTLTPELTDKEFNHFYSLLEETVFSTGGLNLLSKFGRSMGSTADKITVMYNLMESLALHSAFRYKRLNLKSNLVKKINELGPNTLEAKQIVAKILVGEDPINAIKYVKNVKGGVPSVIKRIQKVTGIKLNNPLLKHSEADLQKFLTSLIKSKRLKGEVDDDTLDITIENDISTLMGKVNIARDTYVHNVVKEIFKGDNSVHTIIEKMKTKKVMSTEEASLAESFMEKVDNVASLKDLEKLMNQQKTIVKLLPEQVTRVQQTIDDFIINEANKTDQTLSLFIEANKKLIKSIENNIVKRIQEDIPEYNVFTVDDFYTGDNLVRKSLDHIMNPYTEALVYDNGIAKALSDSIDKHIFNGKLDMGFYDISKGLRQENLTDTQRIKLEEAFKEAKEALDIFINPELKTKAKKLSSNTMKEIRANLKNRNATLRSIYKDIKTYVGKETSSYDIVTKEGKVLDQKTVQKELFQDQTQFGSYQDLLATFQNKVKFGYFDGYQLNVSTKTFEKYTGLEEEKTFFNRLTGSFEKKEGVSGGGVNFIPLKIIDGDKKYKFFRKNREAHTELNNLYKYIKDGNYVGYETEENLTSQIKKLVKEPMNKLGYKEYDLEDIARTYGLSDEVYILYSNIGDKDGSGIAFNITKEYGSTLDLNGITNKVRQDFAVRHKEDYKYSPKDKASTIIGKRISVGMHEDTTMTPGVELDMLDIVVEELPTIATYLSKKGKKGYARDMRNRYDGVEFFTKEQEDRILEVIKQKKPTIEDMSEVVSIYEGNTKINDGGIIGMQQVGEGIEAEEALIKAKYSYLTTANTDGYSEHGNMIHELMSYYQGYVHMNDPAKYHYAELGADMAKTSWNPYTKEIEQSVGSELKTILKKEGFEVGATRLVGEESKKLQTGLTEVKDKYIKDGNGVLRKVIGYKISNTKYNRPASEEVYKEGREVNGVTKQVIAQSHPIAKKLISDYEVDTLNKAFDKLNTDLGLGVSQPISMRSDYGNFLNSLDNNLALKNIGDSQRAYVKGELRNVVDSFEKPKAKGLGYRAVFIPRSTYIDINGNAKATQNNEVYVSPEQYDRVIQNSETLSIERDGVKEYYAVSYRSPVPNTENVTLHKIVVDTSMVSQDVIAVSPFVANVLKQADFDGDHLNLVFIKKGVHAGGLGAALGFLLNRDIPEGELNKLMANVYNKDLTYSQKEDFIYKYIEDYVTVNDNIQPSSVSVKQVKPDTDILLDEVALYENNIDNTVDYYYNKGLSEDGETFSFANKAVHIGKAYKDFKVDTKGRKVEPTFKALKTGQEYSEEQIKGFLRNMITEKVNTTGIGESLYKANVNAIVGQDNINLVSASTRTYTILRDLAWEFRHSDQTGVDTKQLAKLLSLKEDSSEFTELIGLFNGLNFADKTYSSEAASINQMTVDAAKTGLLPPNWEKNLRKAALGTDTISKELEDYITNISVNFSKIYPGKKTGSEWDIFDFMKIYDFSKKEKVNTESMKGSPKTFGNNIYIRDIIRNRGKVLHENFAKGKESYEAWLEAIHGIKPLKDSKGQHGDHNLKNVVGQLLEPKDRWLMDLLLNSKATSKVAKYKLENNIPKIKSWEEYAPGKKRPIFEYESEVTLIDNATIKELGLSIEKANWKNQASYTQNKFFYNAGKKKYMAFTKNPRDTLIKVNEGQLVKIPSGKEGRKIKDKILERIISKLQDKQASIEIDLETRTYSKEDITKLLHSRVGNKLPSEYLEYKIAEQIFPTSVLKRKIDNERLALGEIELTTFLKDNLESEKVSKVLKKDFKGILDKLGDIGDIHKIDLQGKVLTVQADNTNLDLTGSYQIDKDKYTIKATTGTEYTEYSITNDSGEELLNRLVKPTDVKSTIANFKSTPLTADADLEDVLGANITDIRSIENKLTDYLTETTAGTNLINSDLAMKYFMEEMVRNKFLMQGFPKGAYDRLSFLRKKHTEINSHAKRSIDNLIYYTRNGNTPIEKLDKYNTKQEIAYKKDMEKFYDKYLHKVVIDKRIRIPKGYNQGSIIEDITGLEIDRTYKIPFLEKKIFNKADFDKLSKERMGDDYKDPITKDGKTKFTRRVDDLFGGIFERNVLDQGWWKAIKHMRNTAYQVIYGSLSWFTTMGGLLVGASQIPTEMLRIGSMTNKIKGLNDYEELNRIITKYGILNNLGFETAVRVGPQELDAPYAQKLLYTGLDGIGALVGINKGDTYQKWIRAIAGVGGNPMLITDLVVDTSRKSAAIADTIYMLGFNSTKDFTNYIDTLSTQAKERFLAKVNLASSKMYHDLSGGVTASSYLWRESYFSRQKMFLPFNFLMGWSNRILSSGIEDSKIFLKGMRKLAGGDIKEGIDLMFNKSKAIDKLVTNSILSIGVYAKANSHDDYEGEFAKRKSIWEWIQGMNSNIIALGMFLPTKMLKAGVEGEEGFDVRVVNAMTELLGSVFRELDIVEMAAENMKDWTQGDRESIIDAVLDAANARAMKGLAYNKVLVAESLYSDFRARRDFESMLGIGTKNLDEEAYYDLHAKSSDLLIEGLIEDNRTDLVVLNAIKALPFVSLALGKEGYSTYEAYVRSQKEFVDYLSTPEYNEVFLDIDKALGIIENGKHINNLYKSLQTPLNTEGLDKEFKAKLKSDLARLNEDLLVNKLKEVYGDKYFDLVEGSVDGGLEYLVSAELESEKNTNQLLLKIQSESPAAAPYILAQILNQDFYEYEKAFKKTRGKTGTEFPMTEREEIAVKKALLKKYEPLIRASSLTEGQLATYLAVSAKPEFLNNILTDSGYIKDIVADRVVTQLAVSKSLQRGETNPQYLSSRLGGITTKLEKAYTKGEITEATFKSKILDLFNFGLDNINNSTMSTDQKVELKTTMLKSLGEYGYVLNEDPLLSKGFEGARVNLMHKLFDTIIDLKPYAEQAKIDIAESTGRISKGTSSYIRSGKNYPKGLANRMGGSIPQLRNMLTNPKNGFRNAFRPGYSGYNKGTGFRPLNSSGGIFQQAISEYRKALIEQKSLNIIKSVKKYKAPEKYIKVGKAETIKVALKKNLKTIYGKRSKGLLSGLPYNR